MVCKAIARWRRHPRIELLGELDAPRLPIVSFLIRSAQGRHLHPRFVTRLLNDLFGIQTRAGCACAGPYAHRLLGIGRSRADAYRDAVLAGFQVVKPGWDRLDFSYFIDAAEFDFLLDAVEFVADHGAQFIAAYRCDWASGAWRHPRDAPETSLAALAALAVHGSAERAQQTPLPAFHECLARAGAAMSAQLPMHARYDNPLPQGLRADLVSFCHESTGPVAVTP